MPRDGRNPQTGASIKITILKPVAGTFGLSASIGDTITINYKSGTEMIKGGYADEVKRKKFKSKK